jgi:DNA-binding CsgD family transcriptional regulator
MYVSGEDLQLISEIYDVVLEPDAWSRVLDRFVQRSGAAACILAVSDATIPEIELSGISELYRNHGGLNEYLMRFAEYERPAYEAMRSSPPGVWVSDEDAFQRPIDEIESSLWLREHVGVFRRFAARLNGTRAWFDQVTLAYGVQKSDVTSEEHQHAGIFLPHLAKAVETTRPFLLLQSRFHAVLEALDRFRVGVFILSSNGNVVVHNREADRIVSLDDGLVVDGSHCLRSHDANSRNALSQAVQRAAATAAAQETATGKLLSIQRRSGGDPFLVGVSPIGSQSGGYSGRLRGALVVAIDPENRAVISTAGIETLYGLTKAEGDVLNLLVQGHTTRELAEIRGTAADTVRAQVKSILMKTQTKGRPDLVRLALSVNLPVDTAPSSRT